MTKQQKEFVQKSLILINRKEMSELMGWGKGTVDKLFSKDPEFPSIKIGKTSVVEFDAFKDYLKKRHG